MTPPPAAVGSLPIAYKNRDAGRTTNLVEFRNVKGPDDSLIDGYKYSYDNLGNITEIAKGAYPHDPLAQYTYDSQNQLLTETIYEYTSATSVTVSRYTYTYDTAGNLLTKTYYESLTDTDPTVTNYTYGNTQWRDLLTAYDGGKLAYEGQTYRETTNKLGQVTVTVTGTPTGGNPISYYNGTRWSMTWEQGRNLKTATNSTTNTTVVSANKVDTEIAQAYTYDADGIRTGKTSTTKIYKYSASTGGGVASVGDNVSEPNAVTYVRYLYSTTTTAHSYITQNGKVVRETIGSGTTAKVLDFIYDESGKPFALRYTNGTASPVTYYYVLNLQGDVVGLLNSSGTLIARYAYNAWGEIISVTNAAGTAITGETHIANLNPLRYRGYYYDTETGFYYLQSRYYDPVTHRFINADSYASTGQGFVGTNMFAYCLNNPVNMSDSRGGRPIWERDYGNGLVGSTDAGTGCPYNAPSPYSVGLREEVRELMNNSYPPSTWETLSEEEKKAAGYAFFNELSGILNISNYTLRYDKRMWNHAYGGTSAEENIITISTEYINSYVFMQTIAHEAYHAYQNNMIYGISEPTEPMCYLNIWAYEIAYYIDDGSLDYYNQYIEISAEWFGGQLIQENFNGYNGYGYYFP